METLGNGLKIIGTGAAIADQTLTNQDLSHIVETSDEWIQSRTGMRQRHVCLPTEGLTQLGVRAGQAALEMAGLQPQDIELIILATSTPDDLFGSADQIQAGLGASNAFAFDITAACSG
ncbi:MAG: 3-oxoacyl-ACP synthase, partial [Prochlorothrix sp.]